MGIFLLPIFFMNIYYRGEMIYCYNVILDKEDKYHGKT